jgi:hypothetical protein
VRIIDFAKKGNVVRFYLGQDDLKSWWGDDWNDAPYDCNAGTVYEEYQSGYRDYCFTFDWLVLEPCDGAYNCEYTKEDMIKRRVPCIIAVPPKLQEDSWETSFAHWVAVDGVTKFYFGDKMEVSGDAD